jgi:hypothetical protein
VTGFFGSGAPARDADGSRPREPGMTEDSSDKLAVSDVDSPSNADSHITKQVLGKEDTIQFPRVGDHDHSHTVNQGMGKSQLRVFLLHSLCDDLSP